MDKYIPIEVNESEVLNCLETVREVLMSTDGFMGCAWPDKEYFIIEAIVLRAVKNG